MDKNKLILTVGLPRSGKTTWAKDQGHPIVSPDAVRISLHLKRYEPLAEEMVWAITKIMVRSLFKAGHKTVIIDATNNTKKRRDAWKSNEWELSVNIFRTSKEECINRSKKINDLEIIPIIERMHEEHEPCDEFCDGG